MAQLKSTNLPEINDSRHAWDNCIILLIYAGIVMMVSLTVADPDLVSNRNLIWINPSEQIGDEGQPPAA